MDRLPFRATPLASPYEGIGKLPVVILLDNVRSMYNVGSFFRTADAASAHNPPPPTNARPPPRQPPGSAPGGGTFAVSAAG